MTFTGNINDFFYMFQLLNVEEPWTLILDDALANSFIAPATDNIKDDHQLSCEFFSLLSWQVQCLIQNFDDRSIWMLACFRNTYIDS